MSNHPGIHTQVVEKYLNEFCLREPEILKSLREETVRRQRGFLLQPTTGQALSFLLRAIGAKRTLDIGCFTGYSALTAALTMGPQASVITMDVNTEWTQLAKEFWEKAGASHQIELKLQPALTTLDELIESGTNGFDLAFIDADKGNYENYIERSYRLLRAGGLIAVDNTLWSGEVADPNTTDKTGLLLRQLNAKLLLDDRFDYTLLPVGDGLTVLRKR